VGWAGGDERERETDRDRDISSRDEVYGWEVEGSGAGIRPEKGLRFFVVCFWRREEKRGEEAGGD
jgi:hypothetical protein